MKKGTFIEFVEYFKDSLNGKNINYIESIITSDDRNVNKSKELVHLFAEMTDATDAAVNIDLLDSSDKRKLTSVAKKNKKLNSTVDQILNINKNITDLQKRCPVVNRDDVQRLERILTYYISLQKGISPAISIIFRNGDIWNLENTSSLRSDRNIGLEARLSQFRSERNYLIIDEFGKEGGTQERPYTDPRNNVRVVSREEFIDELMWQIYKYNNNKPWPTLIEEKNQKSVVNSHRGNEWEKIMEKVLLQPDFMSNVYDLIINKLALDEGVTTKDIAIVDAKQISGTNKTDFYIEYSVKGVTKPQVGVSMKASGENNVSVHQTKATDLISGLGITDPDVIKAINQFQASGSGAGLTSKMKADLKKYFANATNYDKFVSWAFTRGAGVAVKYILLHSYVIDKNTATCHMKLEKIDDYMARVKAKSAGSKPKSGDASFGTGMSWTRPSKAKEIQLKTPFLFD